MLFLSGHSFPQYVDQDFSFFKFTNQWKQNGLEEQEWKCMDNGE